MNPEIQKQFKKKELKTIRYYLALVQAAHRAKEKKEFERVLKERVLEEEAVK